MFFNHSFLMALVMTVSVSMTFAEPVISEVMADNQLTLADPQGEFDDWVELYNPDGSDLDLGGYYFSDDPDDRAKWRVPFESGVVVPAGGYLVLWLDNDVEDGADHLPFRLAAEGDVLMLTAPDGVTLIEQVTLPLQHPDISYGRSQDHEGPFRFLVNPTPGAINNPLGVALLEGVTFSHDQGTFVEAFDLVLATSSDGATIRYTLDGTIPTTVNGQAYSAPLTVEKSTCVRAALFLEATQISPVESRIFFELDGTLAAFDSNLPIVLLDSQGYDFSGDDDPRTDYPAQAVCAGFFETGEGGRAAVSDSPQFIGRAGMNVRGASSKTWPKKQFKFETWDEEDKDRDVGLLGMPSDSDWLLQAPYFDKSLMRNDFVYHWWEQLGYYSPRTRYVEVFLNPNPNEPFSMEHYRGIYVLTEKIKRSSDRMDLARLEADDLAEPEITGGYIAQATNINQNWDSGEGTRYKYVEPSQDDPLNAQKTWLRNYVEAAEDSVYAGNFADPVNGYAKYLDVPSQIDYDIMRELSRNADGASTFFSIDRGGKLKMGPLWDYNQALGLSSLGAAGHGNSWETFGWNTYYMRAGHWLAWWNTLDDDPNYQMAWNDRWANLRESTFSSERLLGQIDSVAALLEEAQVRNFEKWDILGKAVWIVNGKSRADPGDLARDTYTKEIAFLRDWVEDRLNWIDLQVPSPPDFNQNGGAVAVGFSLEMSEGTGLAPFPGEVFYTLDGIDPAFPGAIPLQYTAPLVLDESVQVLARTMSSGDGSWSSLREVTFIVGTQPPSGAGLVISEIHYNPVGADDLEFIEIANRGASPINLTGVRLSAAVEFEFGATELMPGGVVLVVEDEEAFRAALAPPGTPDLLIAGQWSGRLNNAGETIDLLDPEGAVIHRVAYREDGEWPGEADGKGFTLQLKDLGADPAIAANWRLSTFENGSPGSLQSPEVLTFEEWQERHFTVAELGQPQISGLSADSDGDGLTNLLEFGLATLPLDSESEPPVQLEIETIEVAGVSQSYLTLTFNRPAHSELQYALLESVDLRGWNLCPLIPVRAKTNAESEIETITVRESQPLDESVTKFLRIQVSR